MRGDWPRRVLPWHAVLPASERVPISRPRPCSRSPATRPTVARRNYQRRRAPTGFGSTRISARCHVGVPGTQHSLAVAAAIGMFMSHNETLSRSIILWESRRTLKCRNVAAGRNCRACISERDHPGRTIFLGSTTLSNSSAVTKPDLIASSRSVVPLACAALAMRAALS